MEKRESSYTVGGNVNWCSHYGKTEWRFLKKLKTALPYDLTIPFLGIYSDKTIIQKDTHTSVFIAALFTIAKTWNQPNCLSTDEWIKMCYKYTQSYAAIEECNEANWRNIDGPRDYHTKQSQ